MLRWSFAKGHGTENDFVLLQDPEARLQVGPAQVRSVCDRHAGVGADGLLRAVRGRHIPEWDGDGDTWFMDYRNADGSVAEMCGNGLRVFARYLMDEGLAEGPAVPVATRAGLMQATALDDGRIRVSMGPVQLGAEPVTVTTADGRRYPATQVDVGNPHAVSFEDDLAGLPLGTGPRWEPATAFPDGANLEFVRLVGPDHIALRVYERGVGETRSCGTGTVAAAAAAAAVQHPGDGTPRTYQVDVPGGSVEVELGGDQAYLTGPAVIVAHGELTLADGG